MKYFFRGSFWILLISILGYIFFSSIIDYSISKNYITKSVNNSVHDFESVINDFDFENNLLHNSNFFEDINWLYYKNDSLQSWSTNQFPDISLSNLKFGKTVLIYKTNGVFLVFPKIIDNNKIVFLKKLYDVYPYENEFLKNGFTWNFELMDGVSFSKSKTDYAITNSSNDNIGYLKFKKIKPSENQTIVLLVLFLILYLSLLSYSFQIITHQNYRISIKRLIYYTLLGFYFLLFCYVPTFSFLKLTDAFQPDSFAYTRAFPSIISLVLISFTLLGVLIFEYKNLNIERIYSKPSLYFRLFFIGVSFINFVLLIPLIINNTASTIGFNELSEINVISILVFFALAVFVIDFIIFVNVFFPKKLKFDLIGSSISLIILAFSYFIFSKFFPNLIVFFIFFGLIYFRSNKILKGTIAFNIALAVLLSFLVNLNLNTLNKEKEQEKRKILIQTLALNQDPEVEFLFGVLERKIYNDSLFINVLAENWFNSDIVKDYLKENYFNTNKHWRRYDFQITTCDLTTKLIVKPSNLELGCNAYFYNNLISKGYTSSNKNLYRMEYGSGQINYLGILRIKLIEEEPKIVTIYIEINSKIKRKGFTKLLSPSGMDPFEKIRDYSLSRYKKGFLTETYGDYSYNSELADTISEGGMYFTESNKFSHLLYKPTNNTIYVLSRPLIGTLQSFAPFANLFILTLLISILFLVLFNPSFNLWITPKSFSFRLQINLIILITISLLIISIISGYFIRKSNYEKDIKNHLKTANSLQTEFEQKLSKTVEEGKNIEDYLYELSLKFSSVFNTDINLYNLNGILISSTRPQIFENQLLSLAMNPKAFHMLSEDKSTYISLNEQIGKLEYFSAYMPFHDANGEVVAYLNLPHISQQDQLSTEVSSFIMTLMNVYMLIMVISVLAILLLSNYIIRPLRLIKDKMQRIKIGGKNEHIYWKQKDELGELVQEYNKMVDQISKSAEIMARAERESAWQQMAQQVAHEIKNPLTPMKLSVQYLLKSLDDGQPDWEIRLRKLSLTLIEQIDTLADIATAFSDFAKMPVGEMEEFDLSEVVEAAVQLFNESSHVDIVFENRNQQFPIIADRKNMIRVFNNIIKNAIQSIGFQEKGIIKIKISSDESRWKVSIIDNGCGISEAEKNKIFLPNFTTKSSGMGLGLVMVRNILLQHGGSIDFESVEGEGTKFYLWFNKLKNV